MLLWTFVCNFCVDITFDFLGYLSTSRNEGSYAKSLFHLLRHCHSSFSNMWHHFLLPLGLLEVSVVPTVFYTTSFQKYLLKLTMLQTLNYVTRSHTDKPLFSVSLYVNVKWKVRREIWQVCIQNCLLCSDYEANQKVSTQDCSECQFPWRKHFCQSQLEVMKVESLTESGTVSQLALMDSCVPWVVIEKLCRGLCAWF
jgi:hypothetical protein